MVSPVGSTTISQAASAHTLQAFIELVYIKTANDVLVTQMASLEAALGITKQAMDTLTQIQNLHNLVAVKSKGTFNSGVYSARSNINTYRSAASAFFGTPVQVSVSYASLSAGGIAGSTAFKQQMTSIVNQLRTQISSLTRTTPIIGSGTDARVDSNSLLSKLRLVLKDITDTHAASTTVGASSWVIDNYNSVGANNTKSGNYQQNITNAITAGQSLNTTQTESVRNFLYIFEEYYKSASAVLQAISQIIQKMADGIAR